MHSNEIIENIELEIKKYIDICTIFKKLKDQGCIQSVFNSIYEVFSAEHEFTKKELLKLASQNKDSFDFMEHYKLNSSIFKSNFLLILQNLVEEIWSSFLRAELTNQQGQQTIKHPEIISHPINKPSQSSEIEEYLSKNDKIKNHDFFNDALTKQIKNINSSNRGSHLKDNNSIPHTGSSTKPLEHSKSREKIIQQAFFSNINNSYGSLTSQKNPVSRNISSGIIKTPQNNEKIANYSNIGVSYNVNSVRSPKVNNFVGQSLQNKKAKENIMQETTIRLNTNKFNSNQVQQFDQKPSYNIIEKYLKT